MAKIENRQIKSSERVRNQGEVFTNEREVKAMCDLVSQECDRIDSRFLEPACGDGNFLAEILERKLTIVKKRYKAPYDFERYSILAVSSLYGVDLMEDNVKECRNRLYIIWLYHYKKVCKKHCSNDAMEAVKYILIMNILCGNALSLMKVDGKQQDTDSPIIFPEWSLIGNKFKRRDFRLDVLLKAKEKPDMGKLFDDSELDKYLSIHPATGEYIPQPIIEYSPVNIKKLMEAPYEI